MEELISDLKRRIRQKIPSLTSSQKIIADFIVENPYHFASCSIRELEEVLHISKSTIVRLAQTLGYGGFQQLRSEFLSGIRHETNPIQRYKSYLTESKDEMEFDYLRLLGQENVGNINHMLHNLDRNQYSEVIRIIEDAANVYTLGLGISNYLAGITSYFLNRISVKSECMFFGGFTFTERVVGLSEKDLLFAFSFPPYSVETVEAARYAQEKKIRVIAITDKATSDIAQFTNAHLQVAVDSFSFSNSISAVLVLVLGIVAEIAENRKEQTLQN